MTNTRLQTTARFGDAFDGAAAQAEVHRRLAFAAGAFVSAHEMRGRHRAGDEEDPDVIVESVALYCWPQRRSCSVFSGGNPKLRHSRYVTRPSNPAHSSTSLKCGIASPCKEDRPVRARLYRRPVHVVQQASTRSLAGARSFSPCWYWIPMARAAELIRDPDRGDVHLALLQGLRLGQLGFLIFAPLELHSFLEQPGEHLARFGVGHLQHGGIEGRIG
jgi:hypothetical protein